MGEKKIDVRFNWIRRTKIYQDLILFCISIDSVLFFPRSALVKLVCGIYALIIVVLGVVFAVATSLTAVERVHRYYLEVGLLGNVHIELVSKR